VDEKPVNFTTIGAFLKLPAQVVYHWYRQYLSGYKEAVEKGEWGQHDLGAAKAEDRVKVPILKPENVGEQMAIDEKTIGDDIYTVMTNRETGKIALLAQTLQKQQLEQLLPSFGNALARIGEITADLSPLYESFCSQHMPQAVRTADKFHVLQHTTEAVQALRIRFKQQELAKLPKGKKQRATFQAELLANGETKIELLTRSRYLLFKLPNTWTPSQQKRSQLLFQTYPQLEKAYHLHLYIRQWYKPENVGKSHFFMENKLYEWYEKVETENIYEMNNLIKLFVNNEEKILNYFKAGKTNALAEAVNSKIQRFIASNYGIRDHDFFFYRLATYYS
jgi:transposase